MIKDGDIVTANENGDIVLDMSDSNVKTYTVAYFKDGIIVITPKKETEEKKDTNKK